MTLRELAIAVGFKVDQSSKNKVNNDVQTLANTAKKILGTIGVAVSVTGIANFARDCVNMASDVSEMESKFNVVFGNMTDEVNKWAEDYAKAIGRNKNTIKTYLADQQNLLVGFTDGSEEMRAEAALLSEQMTSLALDIASFSNTDETAAVNYMTKAVMGETEAAKMLGAVLTDVTREEAMFRMGIGGSYDKLDQYTKMLVNLNAIEYQSKDAIGDCVNSMGRYESNTRVLNAGMQELKETIGQGILPVFNALLKMAIPIVNGITSVVKRVTGAGTEVNKLEVFIGKVTKAITWVTDKMGGAENAMRVLGIAAGVLAGALAFSFLNNNIGKIMKFMNTIKLVAGKFLLWAAVIAIVALIIDDFINFLQGNDSVIGAFFESIGVDCDEVRETIFNAWESIKGKLLEVWEHIQDAGLKVWEAIKMAAEAIFNGLKAFWNKWGEDIIATFSIVFSFCGDIFNAFLDVIIGIADFIGAVFSGDWSAAWQAICDIFSGLWNGLVAFVQGIWETIKLLFKIGLEFISGLWNAIWGGIKDFFVGIWDSIVTIVSSVWTTITETIGSFLSNIWTNITNTFTNIWTSITEIVGNIKDAIINGLTVAIEWIKNLPSQAVQWGKDMIQGLIDGITGMISGIGDAVKGVAEKITSFLHFSVPDEGPLTEYESWMPDMMKGLGKGIKGSKDSVLDEVKAFATDMALLVQSGSADTQAVANGSVTNNSTRNVTQNVNISNSYTGSDMQTQNNVSKAMNKSANDATAYMARGLAFAR